MPHDLYTNQHIAFQNTFQASTFPPTTTTTTIGVYISCRRENPKANLHIRTEIDAEFCKIHVLVCMGILQVFFSVRNQTNFQMRQNFSGFFHLCYILFAHIESEW